MTPEERQALREKHRNEDGNCAECCVEFVDEWQTDHFSTKYPCDVIKVLDALDKAWKGLNILADAGLAATGAYKELLNVMPQPLIEPEVIKGSENLKSSDLKTEVECGHMDDERYGEIVFNGIVYKLVPTDHGRGPRSRKKSECSHVLASKQPRLFETGEFIIDIMVANCWCPKCGEKL